jgi:hypothetical protein
MEAEQVFAWIILIMFLPLTVAVLLAKNEAWHLFSHCNRLFVTTWIVGGLLVSLAYLAQAYYMPEWFYISLGIVGVLIYFFGMVREYVRVIFCKT